MYQRYLTLDIIVYCYKYCILIYVVNCTIDELTYFQGLIRNEILRVFWNVRRYYGFVVEIIIFFYHDVLNLVTFFYFFSYFSPHGILSFTITLLIIFFFFFIIIFSIIFNFHFIFFFTLFIFIFFTFIILILFIFNIFPFFKFREIFNM